MIVEFYKSFYKSIDKISDSRLLSKIKTTILKLEISEGLDEITNNKKLIGYANYYRIKIGNYRLGYEKIDAKTIRLITIAHRRDIY
jgi:mRNA interferase RelE/StbE